ncbi:ParA family protein [Thermomonas flagellata]|uniref:ParA family protein n=1 Tax=Thermomonas flagellata TaxID=2888524 RepID=UPI001F03F91C|nr:ParA family protein [Thermomonas flagellata]
MKIWLVACAKGGVGKTTLATQLVAATAADGHACALVDADPQQSATRWAMRRAALGAAPLAWVDGTRKGWRKALPDATRRVVVDTPAGADRDTLEGFLDEADALLVPVQPSALDLEAAARFLQDVARHPRIRKGKLRVGLVGNRLRPHTLASQQALEQLQAWPFPLVAQLRDSQAYVVLTGLGRSLFDYHSAQVREHQADWAPLQRWLQAA